MNSTAQHRARVALITSIGFTVVIYCLPFGSALAYPLVLLSTLAHEVGHGIAAMMVGSQFESFVLYSDGSGAAITVGNPGRLASGFISAGGLVGPAIAAAGCFVVGKHEKASKNALVVIGGLLMVAMVMVIRNVFGWVFVGSLASICLWSGIKSSKQTAQMVVLFVGVQLALSVFSRSDYLFTSVANTGLGASPSDVELMSRALFLPYWFWGLVCGGISIATLCWGLRIFWGNTQKRPHAV